MQGDELCPCAILRPGGSTLSHMVMEVMTIVAIFGGLVAAYRWVPGVPYVVHTLYFWLTGSYF